ncbi:MAG TPA: hypothetical protein VGN69_05440 [Solirubrobacteraceae bacterium]|jgi:hypothetical protein|nr:hypothetical protein [Solirubrobacteraceae bacterium]
MRVSLRRSLALAAASLTMAVALMVGLGRDLAPAGADADPASDVLLVQNVFFPYSPPPSSGLRSALTTLTADAAKAGFPIKVAIIGSAADMGAVSDQFGQAQHYADFLNSEISFNHKQPLLVVMPAGFGVSNVSSPSALKGLSVDAQGATDGLTRAAIAAVGRLAAAAGHPLKVPAAGTGPGSSSGGTSPVVIVGAIVALLALAGAVTLVSSRAKAREEAQEDAGGEDAQEDGGGEEGQVDGGGAALEKAGADAAHRGSGP